VIAVTATGKRDFRALLIESGAWEGVSVSVPAVFLSLVVSSRAPQAPMHFPDAGRPVFISREASWRRVNNM